MHQSARPKAAAAGYTLIEVMVVIAIMSGQDISFDLSPGQEDDDNAYTPSQYLLSTESQDPAEMLEAQDWEEHTQNRFNTALAELDDRSKDILSSRWLGETKSTLQDLADKYGVSAERIRQLEFAAINKLKSGVQVAAM